MSLFRSRHLPASPSAPLRSMHSRGRQRNLRTSAVAFAGLGLLIGESRAQVPLQQPVFIPVSALPEMPQPAKTALVAELPNSLRLTFSDSAPATASPTEAGNALPDAPDPQTQAQTDRAPSTKRILGVIPNFRTVSTDERLPPQTVKEKFVTASQDCFDYSSIFIPAALAGYSLGTNADPEFGGGGLGYGRYLWHAVVDQTTENYLVEFIFPVATHEDSRFYTQGRGPAVERAGYALTRIIFTRSDAGNRVFNISEVVGAGSSAGLSSLYYPTRERSVGNTTKQWGVNLGVDAISFMFKEFWPDINQKLFGVPKTEGTGAS